MFFISTYHGRHLRDADLRDMPLWWAGFYVLFVGLNIVGVAMSFRFTLLVTLLALLVLAVYWISALPHFDICAGAEHRPGRPRAGRARPCLPFGVEGILKAQLPFAVWFFLAIEQLPLAAEESHDPQRDMPKGILLGMVTLILTGLADPVPG